jgi:hypothetical protein
MCLPVAALGQRRGPGVCVYVRTHTEAAAAEHRPLVPLATLAYTVNDEAVVYAPSTYSTCGTMGGLGDGRAGAHSLLLRHALEAVVKRSDHLLHEDVLWGRARVRE